MSNETEVKKLNEMIKDYKSGKLHLKGYEFMALDSYLKSLQSHK